MLTGDYAVVSEIARAWGIGLPDLFASVVSMRLKREDIKRMAKQVDRMAKLSQYEQSVLMKAKLKEFLVDTEKMPKELIFLMRNMRLVFFSN